MKSTLVAGFENVELAVRYGKLKILQYLLSIEPFTSYTYDYRKAVTAEAAENGQLEILKYLNAHGFSWSESTLKFAYYGFRYDIVKYLYSHGCPWDDCSMLPQIRWLGMHSKIYYCAVRFLEDCIKKFKAAILS